MIIALDDGTPIRGDFVLSATQRFDCTPIPGTLELVIRSDAVALAQVRDGAVLLAGSSQDRYSIVKVMRSPGGLPQHHNQPVDVLQITAVLEAFRALALPLERAVIRYGASLGDVYRTAGATCRIDGDIPVPVFACHAGDFATPHIARVLQEEAATAFWTKRGALRIVRYADAMKEDPAAEIPDGWTQRTDSAFLERHEIPRAYSVAPDGSIVEGRIGAARGAVFLPRTDARVLDNMTRALVIRRTADGGFAGQLRAGQTVDVAGVRHLIVTAAHQSNNGGGGSTTQTSRLWLATVHR